MSGHLRRACAPQAPPAPTDRCAEARAAQAKEVAPQIAEAEAEAEVEAEAEAEDEAAPLAELTARETAVEATAAPAPTEAEVEVEAEANPNQAEAEAEAEAEEEAAGEEGAANALGDKWVASLEEDDASIARIAAEEVDINKSASQ